MLAFLLCQMPLMGFASSRADLGAVKPAGVKPDRASLIDVALFLRDELLDERDDLGEVFGDTSEGCGSLDVELGHGVEEGGLPESGERAEDGRVGDARSFLLPQYPVSSNLPALQV